ncbi:hypothetical protein HT031_001039 [Scenedesmus sp. PABB004]|nr:hypothetical protein HT031_001039 [Scenedesmus sp. PABB004]
MGGGHGHAHGSHHKLGQALRSRTLRLVVLALVALQLTTWLLHARPGAPAPAPHAAQARAAAAAPAAPGGAPAAEAHQGAGTGRQASPKLRSCQSLAADAPPQDIELLARRARALPPIGADAPVLAASNWRGLANRAHVDAPRAQLTKACGAHLFRYRVVRGVIYADHDHAAMRALAGHRNTFLEALAVAVWLYKDLPDLELAASFADEPSRCALDIPVLQYAIIAPGVAAAGNNTATDADGVRFSVTQLLTGGGDEPADPAGPAPRHYTGWAMNYPWAWENLSLLPSALRSYQGCVLERAGGRASTAQLVWRGSNTGGTRGWPPLAGPAAAPLAHPWAVALLNKRIALALRARSHGDIMDVGLHALIPEIMGPAGGDAQVVAGIRALATRPFSDMERWGRFALQLSIDGHGSPNRLPFQYLQGSSVVLKVRSPYHDSYEELFKEGVHFESCKYDLSDVVERTRELLKQFGGADGRKRMARMAASAGEQALRTFSLLGQLDALAYALLKVKAAMPWAVREPPLHGADRWQVVVLQRGRGSGGWMSPTLRAGWAAGVRQSLCEALAKNLVC